MTLQVEISGLGLHLPPTIETAEYLAPRIGRSAGWIRSRTGVNERRISHLDVAEMSADAGRQALGEGPPPDLLINCGLSPAQLIPDTAPFVLHALGLSGIPAWSIHATCLGFLVALQNATALLQTGAYGRILVVAAERGTMSRDLSDPGSAALIGDGAGAVLLTRPDQPHKGILAQRLITLPEGRALAELRGHGSRKPPGHPDTRPEDNLFRMDGPRIYKLARKAVDEVVAHVLSEAGLGVTDIDLVVPHQASGPALMVLSRMGFAEDRVVNCIGRFGNCIAASLPMTLALARQEGRLREGQKVLLLGTGAGVSVGAAVLQT